MDAQAALRRVLDATPGSIRELGRSAGVSEALLRSVRDGTRRLTPPVRDSLVTALRAWEEACREGAEALEAADLDSSTGGDDDE